MTPGCGLMRMAKASLYYQERNGLEARIVQKPDSSSVGNFCFFLEIFISSLFFNKRIYFVKIFKANLCITFWDKIYNFNFL